MTNSTKHVFKFSQSLRQHLYWQNGVQAVFARFLYAYKKMEVLHNAKPSLGDT